LQIPASPSPTPRLFAFASAKSKIPLAMLEFNEPLTP
jgi:hypothetical protein